MFTPGAEPILTVAVLGDQDAPVFPLVRALARRIRAIHGDDADLFLNPHFNSPPQWSLSFPSWALSRLPSRLLALAAMQANAWNLTDVAWHLNQADAVLLVAVAFSEQARLRELGGLAAPPPVLRDLLLLASYRGLGRVVVFLDTTHSPGPEQADQAERELRMALLLAGLPGDDLPVVRGEVADESGRPSDDVLAAVESHFRTPTWDAEAPLRMVVRSGGPGTDLQSRDARGRITSGRLRRGEIEALSPRERRHVMVRDVRRFCTRLDEATAGQNVAVLLEGVGPNLPLTQRDVVLVGSWSRCPLRASFRARVTFFRTDEGGRHRYVMDGFTPTFLLPAAQRRARVELLDRPRAYPGETFPIRATFSGRLGMLVEPGDAFVMRHNRLLVGHGVVEPD